ncbi:hypothetical protein ACFXG4_30395 [Nocardia sp. NPDC059246]|uniref:hypothetical protein n=1 Tax=unclassified Nocardia TaxID=2637762 RepID=UPI0036A6978A
MTRSRTGFAILFAACLTVLGAVTGCGQLVIPDQAGARPSSAAAWQPALPTRTVAAAAALPGEFTTVNRGDPDAVARTVMAVWFAWNTNTDAGPSDAAARAAPLLSKHLTSQVTGTVPVIGPGARWMEWARQHATAAVQVDASPELVAPQTDTDAMRAFVVTQTLYTPEGQSLDTVVHQVAVQLTNTSSGWEVTHVDES